VRTGKIKVGQKMVFVDEEQKYLMKKLTIERERVEEIFDLEILKHPNKKLTIFF
jgi:hypothetical protein